MCGIFSVINREIDNNIYKAFLKGKARGPEDSCIQTNDNNVILGFHRLAINGLNSESSQPFRISNCKLICNGEIYNYKSLANEHNIILKTDSDCEIIIHLYKKFGIHSTLQLLDGVFAFVLLDELNNNIFIARDRFGVRPLFKQTIEEVTPELGHNFYVYASELKVIKSLNYGYESCIKSFEPGTYTSLIFTNNYYTIHEEQSYYTFPKIDYSLSDLNLIYSQIVEYFTEAVKKRVVDTTERPIACLLSGGLDSSIVAALVAKYYGAEKLETYSIGLFGSEDLKYANIVAQYLGTKHTSLTLTEDEFFEAIPEVIKNIESYDTTTVRASVGNYLIGKYIKNNSKAKVIFNGDGSDELMGGYLYFNFSPNSSEFDKECKRLLKDIHYFDVLRSDRSISSHGLEPRTPFLDYQWVNKFLSISPDIRFNTEETEKFLFRNAFAKLYPDLLPNDILWRTKEAFSDGVSSINKSWFLIIAEKIQYLYKFDFIKTSLDEILQKDNNMTLEKAYYKFLFNKDYQNLDHIIPYLWMPKFVNATDASARTLKSYKKPIAIGV
jgi:asparagine synthase (glutamine-hydrolysing)